MTGSIRIPLVRSRDPLVFGPGGPSIPWPPQDGRFTDAARRALGFAQDEAAQLNHNHVGPVHLFVGLVHEEQDLAARIFAELGITIDQVRVALTSIMGRGKAPIATDDLTLTPRAQRVIDVAIDESRRLGHAATGTEHLLLAVVREGESFTSWVLESLTLHHHETRARILEQLRLRLS